MRLDKDGNLGIGTIAPVDKLDVAGAIRSTGDIKAGDDLEAADAIRGIRLLSTGTTPTLVPNLAALGTGGTISNSGTQMAGTITINTGTTPAATTDLVVLAVVTTFSSPPVCVLSAASAEAVDTNAIGRLYVTSTTTSISITVGSMALTSNTNNIKINYHCIE